MYFENQDFQLISLKKIWNVLYIYMYDIYILAQKKINNNNNNSLQSDIYWNVEKDKTEEWQQMHDDLEFKSDTWKQNEMGNKVRILSFYQISFFIKNCFLTSR